MRNLLLIIVVLAMVFAASGSTNAQGKMSLSIGADVLLPMGTFGDAVSTGFGGSVRGQYDINPMFSAGLTVGYYTWSGKDVAGTTLPNVKGVPARLFGKYYFMPEGENARAYGIMELGMFFGTYEVAGVSGSSSDFNYAPGIGIELPIGGGNTMIDLSARYDAIATSGSTSGSVGVRAGVTFPLGN